MRFSTKVMSGVAAASAAALGVGLLAFAPGVGANFSSTDTATANINVGQFGCAFDTGNDPRVSLDGNNKVSVSLSDIESSAASSDTAPVDIHNSGSMFISAAFTSSVASTPSTAFSAVSVKPVIVAPGQTATVNLGLSWSELWPDDLGVSATATYTMKCSETGFRLYEQQGGTATWDSVNEEAILNPGGTGSGPAAGIQVLNPPSSISSSQEPVFTTDTYNQGSPRFLIYFSNGVYAWGYPSQANASPHKWDVPGVFQWKDWSDVVNYVTTNSLTVTKAFVTADASTPGPVHIGCVNYTGTPLFGTGC